MFGGLVPEQRGLASHQNPTPAESRSWYDGAYNSHDPRDLLALLQYGPSYTPYTMAWTDNRIEQVRHFKHWVYVCVSKIARKIASQMPNITYVRNPGEGAEKCLSQVARTKALTPLLSHEQLEPVEANHPLLRLLRDPNEPDTAYDLWYETILFYLLTGSAYWWVPKNIFGLPSAIWVVPSHWMWPIMGHDRYLKGWEIRPVEGMYQRRLLPEDEVIVFRHKNPISKIDGMAPLTAAAQWADISDSINRCRWHSYKSIMPTVAVQFDAKRLDPSDNEISRIEAKFLARYAGETKAGRPLFLPPGVAVKPLVLKPNEMVFGETAVETRNNIANAYGVPVELIDLQGDTLKALSAFYSETINPLCHFLGQVGSEKLGRAYEGTPRIWWEQFTINDPEQINSNHKVDLLCGALTPNERRIAMGREPYTGEWAKFGNTPFLPVNMESGALPGGGDHTNKPGDKPDAGGEQPALNDEDYKAWQRRMGLIPNGNGNGHSNGQAS
ncbi:MAG TPA: phage portal protein [Tepidisphaeraceae bacterium]|nr:phage portal protein [Tepidisphaeraceae bacterium]